MAALPGVALGLLASAFARTEFQAIQLMPVVVLPQLLLCGLFQPRENMATALRWAADVLPVSYAVQALQYVAEGRVHAAFARDLSSCCASSRAASCSGRDAAPHDGANSRNERVGPRGC